MSLHLGPSDAPRRGAAGPIGSHLGDRVSGFVDGALTGDTLDRCLVHLAGCTHCRDEVEAVRLLKNRLFALPAPEAPIGLVSRLLALDIDSSTARIEGHEPEPVPLDDIDRLVRAGHAGGSDPLGTLRVSVRPQAGRPQGTRPAGRDATRTARRSSRRGVRIAALAGAALSTVVVAVVGLSGPLGSDGRVNAPVSSFTSGGSGTSIPPFVDISRNIGLGPKMRPGAALPDSRP